MLEKIAACTDAYATVSIFMQYSFASPSSCSITTSAWYAYVDLYLLTQHVDNYSTWKWGLYLGWQNDSIIYKLKEYEVGTWTTGVSVLHPFICQKYAKHLSSGV